MQGVGLDNEKMAVDNQIIMEVNDESKFLIG
jgi:hypothetical protein